MESQYIAGVIKALCLPSVMLCSVCFCMTVFQYRVLRERVTEYWRKLRNEELCDRYCSRNNVRMIKSSGIRWAGHVENFRGEKTCV
jgi:hypothetical protein